MQSTGQTSTQARSFTPMQASVMMYGIQAPRGRSRQGGRRGGGSANGQIRNAVVRAQGGWLPPGPPTLSLHAMPHRIPTRALWFAVALLTGGSAFLPVAAQGRCAPAPTALVLSGGGAKGLAHVGVLRALESAGIRPDLIVGSSMGSVVGALAASGYSAASIDSIAR